REVGDDVVVADPDTRLVEGIEQEGVVAQPTGHAVVAGAADDNVVASATGDGVDPGPTGERVVAGIADDDVVGGVTGAVDVAGAGHGQVLEVGGEREGRRRAQHRVGSGTGGFRQGVAAVGDVGVVAGPADQCVGTAVTVQGIVANATAEGVVAKATGEGVIAGAASDALDARDRGEARPRA